MDLNRFFPNFNPLTGLRKLLPVGVSSTQIAEVQNFLHKYSESKIIEFYNTLKELPSKNNFELFCKDGLFPTKKGGSHRAALGKLYKLELFKKEKHPKSLVTALVIMIKLNHMLDLITQTNDFQLLDYPIRHDDFVKYCEATDIALAISDGFGEFKLAQGNIRSSIVRRQDNEDQILSANAQKANNAKHDPLRNIKPKITYIFDTEKLYEKPNFRYRGSDKINYTEIANYIFWEKLELKDKKAFPQFSKFSTIIKDQVSRETVEQYCIELAKQNQNNKKIRFNPIRDIASNLKKHHENRLNKM